MSFIIFCILRILSSILVPHLKPPDLFGITTTGDLRLSLQLGVEILARFERLHQLHLQLGGLHEIEALQPEHGERKDQQSAGIRLRTHSVMPPGLSISSMPLGEQFVADPIGLRIVLGCFGGLAVGDRRIDGGIIQCCCAFGFWRSPSTPARCSQQQPTARERF